MLGRGGDRGSWLRDRLKDFGKFSAHMVIVKILDDISRV